jgi:DNA polymerase-3 subunit beta
MKVICSTKNLQQNLNLAEKITIRHPNLPILNAVLVRTKDKNLEIIATNLEIGLKTSIIAEIIKEGEIAIPAKIFLNFISSLNDEKITLENINNNLVLNTDNSSTTIKGYPVKDFPLLPKIKEKNKFTVSLNDFLVGIKSVYYSSSLSEIKPELNSILVFSFSKVPLTFVATDSFRLAEKSIPYNFSNAFQFLIPLKSAIEILRIFENQKEEEDLKVILDDNNFVLKLKTPNLEFISRLSEGKFPDYKPVVPVKFSTVVTADKSLFLKTLKSASLFSGKLSEIKMRVYSEENLLEFQTNNIDLGEHTSTLKIEAEGQDLATAFNYHYLIDCLNSINSSKIILKFGSENRPLIILGVNDASFRYLVMPMKDV